jgi:uncharacterized protein (DUF1800 family)
MTRVSFAARSVGLAVAIATTAVLARPGLILRAQRPGALAVPDDRTIVHVLNRLGYGPRDGDIERVRSLGLSAYVDLQLHPERIPDAGMTGRLSRFATLGLGARELAAEYYLPALIERRERQQEVAKASTPADERARVRGPDRPDQERRPSEAQRRARLVLEELTQQKILRTVYSERQLEEVMTDFWFNHFNVFAGKGLSQVYLTEYERDVIRPRALGRFRDLLGATARSPAMLFYLDNWMSVDPAAAERLAATREARWARARRFGLVPPRGAAPASGRNPAPAGRRTGLNENYARELMELHTLGVEGGYTQQDVVEVARAFTGWTIADPRQGGGFRFDSRLHDPGKKLVLGHAIKAGGEHDGDEVLDVLARHLSTARFIATKLVRRFVSDDPPASVVGRAAERFRETDGDIREVVRAIITSPEFFAPDVYRAKVKTPLEFVASALRATGARVDDARPLAMSLRSMGMPLYFAQAPTGFADRADAWVSAGSLLSRMNLAVALVANRLRGVQVDLATAPDGGPASADQFVAAWLGGNASNATRKTLAEATTPVQLAALTLGAPEFQRR